MTMLSYNEVTPKTVIVHEGEPWVVLTTHVFSKQQRRAVNATKLRNLKTGRVVEVTFHQNESIEEANIETRPVLYLYENRGEYWFCDPHDKSNRFNLPADTIGDTIRFVPQNTELDATVYDEEIIGVRVPIKMELRVKEAAPAVKGNTSTGAMKDAILETGAKVLVPLFINEGDIIRVNTETASYAERVEKA